MYALQAKGIPVFSLTNFGIQTYDLAAENIPIHAQNFDRDFISGHMGCHQTSRIDLPNARRWFWLVWRRIDFLRMIAPTNVAAADARGWKTHLFETPSGLGRSSCG